MTECNKLVCLDCEQATEYYMVSNEVWLEAIPDYREIKQERKQKHPPKCTQRHVMLCLGCLTLRLGRPLRRLDFPSHIRLNRENILKDHRFFPNHGELLNPESPCNHQ